MFKSILFCLFCCIIFLLSYSYCSPNTLDYERWAGNSTRIMFIVAHPDDIEACAGGLISKLVAQQTSIRYVIVTNGDKGCSNPVICNTTPPPSNSELASIRQNEQINAAKEIGIANPQENVRFLQYEDSMLTSYDEAVVRQNIVQEIRLYQPNVVMTWNPFPNFDLIPMSADKWTDLGYHPDHQQSGKLTGDASFDAQLNRLWPDSGVSWTVSEFYMFEFGEKLTHYVDITDAMDAKLNAYFQHASQNYGTQYIIDAVQFEAASVAQYINNSTIKWAEGYRAFF